MQKVLRAFAGGVILGVLLIIWDVLFLLPMDMNVIGAISLPFFTAGAFIVEILQHTVPLVIWLGIIGQLIFKGNYRKVVFWIGAIIVAAFEPLSQLGGSLFTGYPPAFYVVGAVIVYGVNLTQLYFFSRNGFVPMFVMRLGMYFLWHVVWGLLRLQVLF